MLEPQGNAQWAWPLLGATLVVTLFLILRAKRFLRYRTSSSVFNVVSFIFYGGLGIFKESMRRMRRTSWCCKICCVAVVVWVFVAVLIYRWHGFESIDTFLTYFFFFLIPSGDNIGDIIILQRKLLAEEMEGYIYPAGRSNVNATSLADLIPEIGGQPIRSLILTSWRSGSTFLGSILNSHPANFYHFEPLRYFAPVQIRNKLLGKKAIDSLKSLLECDYSELGPYLKKEKSDIRFFSLNTRLWEQCYRHPRLCWLPEFLTPFCRLFPFHSLKTVRLRLQIVEELLDDPSLNVRVIYLVRDPRATLHSRNQLIFWCRRNPNCIEPKILCSNLVSDFYAATRLSVTHPNTFRVVRYEDLSVNPHKVARELFDFLGLDFHEKVRKYLDTHTSVDRLSVSNLNTHRNSKTTPFKWQRVLGYRKVDEVQQSCSQAIESWGYRLAHNRSHLREFNPVGEFNLGWTSIYL